MFLRIPTLAILSIAPMLSPLVAEASDIAACLKPPLVVKRCPHVGMTWYYDGALKACRRANACDTWLWTVWGGLLTEGECERHCTRYADCLSPFDRGDPVRNVTYTDGWYFNATTGRCHRIVSTGAGAHGVHYHSERTCATECGLLEPETTTAPPSTVSTTEAGTTSGGSKEGYTTEPTEETTTTTTAHSTGTESTSRPTTSTTEHSSTSQHTTGPATSGPPPPPTPPTPRERCVDFSVTQGDARRTQHGAELACGREQAGGRLASIESWAEYHSVRELTALDGRVEYWMSGEFVCPDCRYEWINCTTRNGSVIASWEMEHIAATGDPVDVCLVFAAVDALVAKADCEQPHRPAICERPCRTSTSTTSTTSESTLGSSTTSQITTTAPELGECGCRVTDQWGEQVELHVRLDDSPQGGTCDVRPTVHTYPPVRYY